MRFSLCYRVVRLKGFFWGRRLFFYKRRFAGYLAPVGSGLTLRRLLWSLGDGFWGVRGYGRSFKLRRYHLARVRNAGYGIMRLTSPQIEPFWPQVWNALRYLLIRHHRGRRYRLGLPAHGQRTHSNAATTRHIRNATTEYLKANFWFKKLWEPRKRKLNAVRSRIKTQSKRSAKADKHKRGVLRSKKKLDVWK